MKKLLNVPYNAMEVIHRDFNILTDFVHVKEFVNEASLLEYSDTHFEKLYETLFDYLPETDRDKVEKLIKALDVHITTALDNITSRAKSIQRGVKADYIAHRNPIRYGESS